ncbi:MAG: DUF445 domain-containing protein [Hyphomonas sp.]|nr:DUF445 domain-containing protein [Hyphomonas sp.]MDP3460875.1 DUF445 domain-containing protein [Hyphomonas sp.]
MKKTGYAPRSLRTMRLAAGTLLIAMSALYIVAILNHGVAWGYARSFAEAAMVGGLADWFAVTAIFRRPFGLPIPHTAVIPRSKARIAEALGDFVAVNFLSPDVVRDRLENQDLAGVLARQMAEPKMARRIADGIVDALPAIADILDDEAVSEFMRRQIAEMSRDARLSAAIGGGIRLLTDHGRHQPVLDAALAEGWRALEEHQPAIRANVRARTAWVWRLISLDARAADALIGAIEESLRAIADDPAHPTRQRVTALLHQFSDDLQSSPVLRARIEQAVADALAHPAVGTFLKDISKSLKEAVRENAASPESESRRELADAVVHFSAALSADTGARDAINGRLRALLAEMAGRHGRDVAGLISETIQGWDARTVVDKLEQNVGPDLQYIRINGTLIGGLIGLVIHQTSLWLAPHTG